MATLLRMENKTVHRNCDWNDSFVPPLKNIFHTKKRAIFHLHAKKYPFMLRKETKCGHSNYHQHTIFFPRNAKSACVRKCVRTYARKNGRSIGWLRLRLWLLRLLHLPRSRHSVNPDAAMCVLQIAFIRRHFLKSVPTLWHGGSINYCSDFWGQWTKLTWRSFCRSASESITKILISTGPGLSPVRKWSF